jgi:hypothetical protein
LKSGRCRDACSPSARKRQCSSKEAGPPPSMQLSSVTGLGEESETTERECEMRESVRKRRGRVVRGIMARAWKQHGVSRSFTRHAGKASLCAPQTLPRGNARIGGIHRACVEGAFTRVWTKKKREPRNSINRVLAPQSLVRLLAGNQSRP